MNELSDDERNLLRYYAETHHQCEMPSTSTGGEAQPRYVVGSRTPPTDISLLDDRQLSIFGWHLRIATKSRELPKDDCRPRGIGSAVTAIPRRTHGPFVTLLELHKLMYFMQEAGEPLKLRYAQALYGPYAENLRHVLHHVEGHLVSGYADGGDAPDKQLQLVPGAIDEAVTFLTDHATTRGRFDRVADLVEGFETPFGLELLSTVHWVATREGATSPEEVVARTYAWNERKRRFAPHQITLAFDVLAKKHWLKSNASVSAQ